MTLIVYLDGSYEDAQGVLDALTGGGWASDYLVSAGGGKWVAVLFRGQAPAPAHRGEAHQGVAQGGGPTDGPPKPGPRAR